MTDPTNAHTLLVIAGVGVQPYSARGLTQTLDPISQASNSRRTVNGELKDLSFDGFKKFKSTISCNDQTSPALDGIWPGQEISVECIKELCYLTEGGSPSRPVVSGSSRVEGDFTFYRPVISFMVMTYSASEEEYTATAPWSMQLEEI